MEAWGEHPLARAGSESPAYNYSIPFCLPFLEGRQTFQDNQLPAFIVKVINSFAGPRLGARPLT